MPTTATLPTAHAAQRPLPPGNLGLPFVGETFAFLRDPIAFLDRHARRYGPIFKTRILGDDVVCLVGPEASALLYDDRLFQREGGSPPHFQEIFGQRAVVFQDGAEHRRTRRLMAQAFAPEALTAYRATIDRVLARKLSRWETAGELRGVDAVGGFCFAVADCLFGGADPDTDDPRAAALFQTFLRGVFSLPVNLPFTPWRRAMAARDALRRRVARAVDGHRPGGADHVLARLLAARDEESGGLTPDEVKRECLHFYAAAYAPVQAAACNLLVALSRHPEMMGRTRAAARSGDETFVDQVTREVRRLDPILPSTFFARARKDGEYGGYRIPKGWKAVAALHASMHVGDAYPEAGRFDPDRFAPERGELRRRPPAYLPHGGGPPDGHRCAGEGLADLILRAFAVGLLRQHTWELPPQDLTLRPAGLCPLPADGLRIRFRRA